MTNPTPEMVEMAMAEIVKSIRPNLDVDLLRRSLHDRTARIDLMFYRADLEAVARFVLAREAQAHQAGLREAAEMAKPDIDGLQPLGIHETILAAAPGEK